MAMRTIGQGPWLGNCAIVCNHRRPHRRAGLAPFLSPVVHAIVKGTDG